MNLVSDSSALIAYLGDEPGAELVERLLLDRANVCFVHALNLCEVFYGVRRAYGENVAQETVYALLDTGLVVREDLDEEFWQQAGRTKSDFRRIALADCFCANLADRVGGDVITADREFAPLRDEGRCPVTFIR